MFCRFAGFFILAGLAAWVAIDVVPDPQYAIVGFAIFVACLSLLMPALRFELDGLWVDTLYYLAAALAAVMYFIAAEPEQKIIQLERTLSEAKESKRQSEQDISRLQNELEDATRKIALNAQRLQEVEKELNQSWARRLADATDSGTKGLVDAVEQVEVFAWSVAAEASQCKRTLDLLERARAFRQQGVGRPGDTTPSPSERIQDEEYERERERCSRVSVLQSRIDALGSGYARATALLELSKNTYLTSALIGFALPSAVLSESDRTTIDAIYRSRVLRASHEAALSERETLNATADGLSAQITTGTGNLKTQEAAIEATDTDLTAAKGHPLEGLALLAKDWMAFKWPYFLITFLGMKLARRPLRVIRKSGKPPAAKGQASA